MSKKVLVIYSSVNKESVTTKATNAFVKKYENKYPNSEITLLDLSTSTFSKNSLTAENFSTFWNDNEADKWIDLLKNVDLVVVGAPMYNFNISGMLKNFLDTVCVANKTFSYKYSKKGDAIGLVTNIDVAIIGAQGAPLGWYPFGNHIAYLEGTFKFIGAKNVYTYLIDGVKVAPRSTISQEEIIKEISPELDKIISNL